MSKSATFFGIAAALLTTTAGYAASLTAPSQQKYLAFQIFTASQNSETLGRNFPPLAGHLREQVESIVRTTGTVGSGNRKLGFIVGPLAFGDTDERMRQLMREAFTIALEKNVATGFHVDDSMFWDRLSFLNKPENIEWLDWNKTPNTGRRLDWSSTPTKIMPQLCFNSPAVIDAVKRRAALIGGEALRGIKLLRAAHRENLFIGVIAGWETQIGRDFDTGKTSGYHALVNEGFSVKHPPADVDKARREVVTKFVNLWASSLAQQGVPDDKIYSHTAFMSREAFDLKGFAQPSRSEDSYLQTVNFTPPSASVGPHHRAGFSTYPQFGSLEQISSEMAIHGNPPWASAEGTAVDPALAEKGDAGGPMERYLGNLFNRGAVLVNVFGWGVGDPSNPFRRVVESDGAVAAYRKFLNGELLPSGPPAQIPSSTFFDKLRKLQRDLPTYMSQHGPDKVAKFYQELGQALKAQRFVDAEKAADQILALMEG